MPRPSPPPAISSRALGMAAMTLGQQSISSRVPFIHLGRVNSRQNQNGRRTAEIACRRNNVVLFRRQPANLGSLHGWQEFGRAPAGEVGDRQHQAGLFHASAVVAVHSRAPASIPYYPERVGAVQHRHGTMSARYADMIVHEMGSGDAARPTPKRETRSAARRRSRRQAEIRGRLGDRSARASPLRGRCQRQVALTIAPFSLSRRAPARRTPQRREAFGRSTVFRFEVIIVYILSQQLKFTLPSVPTRRGFFQRAAQGFSPLAGARTQRVARRQLRRPARRVAKWVCTPSRWR